jgi:hypothetical protein
MTNVAAILEAFKDDNQKAIALIDAFKSLEAKLPKHDIATNSQLKITELTLQKEIEVIRKKIEIIQAQIKD